MNDQRISAVRLGAVSIFAASLSGCAAAVVGVWDPMMQSAADATMTPEKVGISTSTWRGKPCSELESSYNFMATRQQESTASGDSMQAKTSGWQMDAINQVRSEQGCIAGTSGGSTPTSGQVTAYGYCYASSEHYVYVTPMFTYRDFYTDRGGAESDAFTAMLSSTYAEKVNAGACTMEDSPAKAQAAIERVAGQTTMELGRETVRVAWTPPPIIKTPRPQAVAPVVAVSKSVGVPNDSSKFLSDDLGLTLETPGAELVKALGLRERNGAWVVAVTPGSPAAKAGIKPMDVIQALSGQVVNMPGDLQTIAGKLRAGYKAPMGVWRDRTSHELTLIIPATPSHSLAAANTTVVVPTAVSDTAKPSAAPGKLYCHAYVFVQKQPGGYQSPIVERAGESRDPAVMMASLSAFVAKVRQQQPDQWRPFNFPLAQCSSPSGYCFANAESSFFKAEQSAAQFCFLTRAEAETDLQKFNTFTPVYQEVN